MDATSPARRLRLSGLYAHQSTRSAIRSTLEARNIAVPRNALRCSSVNDALGADPSYRGRFRVALAPIESTRKTGGFATDDALYYRDRFTPDPDTPPMRQNLLDLRQLRDLGARRAPLLARMLAPAADATLRDALGDDPDRAAWEEYLCHEAGHGRGLDVTTKMKTGFFRPNGRLAAPLVFAEEHRADLLSFGLAVRLADARRLRAIVAFHLLHRFGLLADGLARRVEHVGLQPYLLFRALHRLRAIELTDDGRLALVTPPARWPELARRLCALAERAFEAPAAARSPLDAAVAMARYVRRATSDAATTALFERLCVTTRTRLLAAQPARGARQR